MVKTWGIFWIVALRTPVTLQTPLGNRGAGDRGALLNTTGQAGKHRTRKKASAGLVNTEPYKRHREGRQNAEGCGPPTREEI